MEIVDGYINIPALSLAISNCEKVGSIKSYGFRAWQNLFYKFLKVIRWTIENCAALNAINKQYNRFS